MVAAAESCGRRFGPAALTLLLTLLMGLAGCAAASADPPRVQWRLQVRSVPSLQHLQAAEVGETAQRLAGVTVQQPTPMGGGWTALTLVCPDVVSCVEARERLERHSAVFDRVTTDRTTTVPVRPPPGPSAR